MTASVHRLARTRHCLLKCGSCFGRCSLSNPRYFQGWHTWVVLTVGSVDQPRFTEYHMETLNVPRRQSADTSTSQADSNLQVTSSTRRRLVPLSSHIHRCVWVKSQSGRLVVTSYQTATNNTETKESEERLRSSTSPNIQSVLSEQGVGWWGMSWIRYQFWLILDRKYSGTWTNTPTDDALFIDRSN